MTAVDVINAIAVWWPVWWYCCSHAQFCAGADWRCLGFVAGICLVLFAMSDAVESLHQGMVASVVAAGLEGDVHHHACRLLFELHR